jgi:hypothetical protein
MPNKLRLFRRLHLNPFHGKLSSAVEDKRSRPETVWVIWSIQKRERLKT